MSLSVETLALCRKLIGKVAADGAASAHLTKEVVTTLPSSASASNDVMYLYKNPNATGEDVYEEWMLINGKLTMIGDTSVDLDSYLNELEIDSQYLRKTTDTFEGRLTIKGDLKVASDDGGENIYVDGWGIHGAQNGIIDSFDTINAKTLQEDGIDLYYKYLAIDDYNPSLEGIDDGDGNVTLYVEKGV